MTATAGLLTNWDLVEVEDPDTFLAVDNCLFCVLEKGGEQKEFHPRQTVNFYSQYPGCGRKSGTSSVLLWSTAGPARQTSRSMPAIPTAPCFSSALARWTDQSSGVMISRPTISRVGFTNTALSRLNCLKNSSSVISTSTFFPCIGFEASAWN